LGSHEGELERKEWGKINNIWHREVELNQKPQRAGKKDRTVQWVKDLRPQDFYIVGGMRLTNGGMEKGKS